MAEKTKAKETPADTVAESTYSVEELIENYKLFGASKDIVIVALRLAKKESMSFDEAKKVIEKFKTKEVV